MRQAVSTLMLVGMAAALIAASHGTVIEHVRGVAQARKASGLDLAALERARVLASAGALLKEPPITVTAAHSPRSAGGLHDFFSEGDYWWPDPANPDGPYIQRDGMSNPDNFVEHRRAMIRLSEHVSTLTSAWILTRDERYAAQAMKHLRAWFVDAATRMNPNLQYAQAIYRKVTGRGTGIIDTIHLSEVARSTGVLAGSTSAPAADITAIKDWFTAYLRWLTTDKNGIEERDAKNNHGTCWVMQVAAFAQLTGDTALLDQCRGRYKEILLPIQMAPDGSFPLELKRTKPYGYSLFNLDAFATICQILSTATDNLWTYRLPDGRSMKKGIAFLFPFMKNKATWPFGRDVMYFDEWPVRQPSLLFAGLAYGEQGYLDLWQGLNPAPTTEEVIRNLPVRHPLLWITATRPVRPRDARRDDASRRDAGPGAPCRRSAGVLPAGRAHPTARSSASSSRRDRMDDWRAAARATNNAGMLAGNGISLRARSAMATRGS